MQQGDCKLGEKLDGRAVTREDLRGALEARSGKYVIKVKQSDGYRPSGGCVRAIYCVRKQNENLVEWASKAQNIGVWWRVRWGASA